MCINLKKTTYLGLTIVGLLDLPNAYGFDEQDDLKVIVHAAITLGQNKEKRKENRTQAINGYKKLQGAYTKAVNEKDKVKTLKAQKEYIKLFDQMALEQQKAALEAQEAEGRKNAQRAKDQLIVEKNEILRLGDR